MPSFHPLVQYFVECIKESVKISINDEAFAYFEKKLYAKYPKLREQSEDEEKKKQEKELREEAKSQIDHALRLVFQHIAESSLQSQQSILDLHLDRFLDLMINIASADFLDMPRFFVILEDIFDSQTIDQGEAAFQLLEQRAITLSTLVKSNDKYRLPLLRLCNTFLGRLSKSDNPPLCGRVYVFLAYLFPLHDKSGVNVKGERNTENTTEYETSQPAPTDDLDPLDFDLYRKFWSLQSLSPSQILSDKFQEFVTCVDAILTAFKNNSETNSLQLEEEDFFAKYLTSSKLFRLELRDVNFQRNMLIQILIMFQDLLNPLQKVQTNMLKDKQKTSIQELSVRVKELLESTPNGKIFAANIYKSLDRENNWVTWKRSGCVSFEKHLPKTDKRKAEKLVEKPLEAKRVRMGNAELSRLWNLHLNEESLTAKERIHTPTLDEFIKPLKEERDSGIEETYKLKNSKVYTWRALRLIARHKMEYFSKVVAGIEKVVDLHEGKNVENNEKAQ